MPNRIKLRDVTAENWEAVAELEVADEQKNLVADNAYSIAESKFDPFVVPKAICAGKRPVGFIMWESLKGDGKPHDYSIFRFMIDRSQQGKGYGRAALIKAIEEIRKDAHVNRITISYVPGNTVSQRFYASLGFEEVGVDEDGEMIAQLAGSKRR